MAKNMKKKKKTKDSVSELIYSFSNYVLDMLVCIYMVLILAWMPFYNEEGFSHIGTDKATFFHITINYCGTVILIVAICALLFKIIAYVQARINAGKMRAKDAAQEQSLWDNVKSFCRKEMSATDWFALVYGICVVFSYACSNYKDEALWGTRGWYMGMIPQLVSISCFFLVSRVWKRRDWIVYMILPVSAIVFLLGYLDRFGIYLLDMESRNVSFISTVGNINWYCGYAMCVFFIGYVLLWKADLKKAWQKRSLMAYVCIGFATILTQGSISGVVALGVILLVTFCLSVKDGKRMEMFWLEMILFSAVCAFTYLMCQLKLFKLTYRFEANVLYTNAFMPILMTLVSVGAYIWVVKSNRKGCYPEKLFSVTAKTITVSMLAVLVIYVVLTGINTVNDGIIYELTGLSENNMFTFDLYWGSNRGATYLAGITCFKEQDFLHKLTGVGPDCMAAYISTDGSASLNAMLKEVFKNARLTNAHNEWLTLLVNIGLPGCICHIGMMATAIYRYIKNREKSVISLACAFCVLAYIVNNMFSFQQSMSLATLYIVFGLAESYLRGAKEKEAAKEAGKKR